MTLTTDQRWLLFAVGGHQMVDCLADPGTGIARLMTSSQGASNGRTHDAAAPDWLAHGFQCGSGKIVSPMFVDKHPRCVVTVKELRQYAADLPPHVAHGLRALSAERVMTAPQSPPFPRCEHCNSRMNSWRVRVCMKCQLLPAENACRALGVEFIALGRHPHTAYASQRHPDGRHRAYVVVDYRRRPKVTPWVPTERNGA